MNENDFFIGQKVRATSLKKNVVIKKINSDVVTAILGNIEIKLNITDIVPVTKIKKSKSGRLNSNIPTASDKELSADFHGLKVDECIERLEKLISDAYIQKIGRLKVVHGIGTGKLSSAIKKYINSSDLDISYYYKKNNLGEIIIEL